ncbi:MAG: lysophospholipid acyltransferase family protein [Aeromicrobium sp.]|nr:lysophospholipid acyltransferase family protein [Burkholderiales bacterium]
MTAPPVHPAELVVPSGFKRRDNRLTRWFGRRMMRCAGWQFEGQLPDVRKLLVSVAPHTSNWDFVIGVLALFALDLRISFLGKHTLFSGMFGKWMHAIGGIPVDRSKPNGVVGDCADAILAADRIVFAMAPEGTRRLDKGFKTGFIHIAYAARVPICLAYFDFKRKVVGFGPLFQPTGDTLADIEKITDYYRPICGRYVKEWQRHT